MLFARRSACTSSIVRHLQYRTSTTHATRRKPHDVQQTPIDYTMKILAEANQGHFKNALYYATKMKTSGIVPTVTIYNALMSLAAREQSWLFAWAMLDDMLHTGVEPTATTFAHLIQAQRLRPYANMWSALQQMQEFGVKPSPSIYTAIIEAFVDQGNIEMALHYLFIMRNQDILPELSAVHDVVVLAANCGYSRLAIELASFYEKLSSRSLDDTVWMTCLASSAQNRYLDGVQTCWSHVTEKLNVAPPEGICLSVLHTAARYGEPDLVTDVLRVLKLTDVSWEEHHFAALIEAFCRKDQLKEALVTLHIMRTNGIEPGEGTASNIVDAIKDVDALDSAWETIDEIHSSGGGLGTDALNVIIKASILLGDLQRAVGIYKAFSDYGLIPDVATFNLLLDGCTAARHRQLGDILLEDMKQTGLIPDDRTYEKMITLCLTQEFYEDAFYYLEEMKAAKYVPPRTIYEAILGKCKAAGDTRADIVVDEMKECGYDLVEADKDLAKNFRRRSPR